MRTLIFQESIEIIVILCIIMFAFRTNDYIFVFTIVLMGCLIFFYRLPKRHLPDFNKEIITAPTDGLILDIVKESNGLTRITIYLSIFDVHVQWYPTHGIVRNIIYKKGEFNLAHILEKSKYNEKMSTIIQNEYGVVRVDQIAGQVARRIANWSISNTRVKRGSLLGMIKLSSRVDLYLPTNKVKILVNKETKITGKLTPIAKWL